MAVKPEGAVSRAPAMAGGQRSVFAAQVLSALVLLAMGAIHIYLVFDGAGGWLSKAFVVNAVGGLVLAIAMVVLRQRLLLLASVLSTLFMAGTLLALVLALTVGLFGVTEVLSYTPAKITLIVESIGTIVLVVTTALVYQMVSGARGARAGFESDRGHRARR
jgi:hypothetical protein